jgi:hypothetical protein
MTLGSTNMTKKQNNKDSNGKFQSLREKKHIKIEALNDIFHIFSNCPLQTCFSKRVNQAFYSGPAIFIELYS